MISFLWIQVFYIVAVSPMQVTSNHQVNSQKYLALGDSYTIGESVQPEARFPIQLAAALKGTGIELEAPQIIAKTGWTTDELMEGIEEANPQQGYDLVTLLIGVNNQYRGRDVENYQGEFETLLEEAIHFASEDKTRVIVISIPDYGVTPFGKEKGSEKIAIEINRYNAINKQITNNYHVSYVDITEISRSAGTNLQLIAEDGLHPSKEMYTLWVDKIKPVAFRILSNHEQ